MTDQPVVPTAPLRQITKLTWPFPQRVIARNPSGGGDYVAHPLVEQRLIDVLGRPPDTELVHLVHGWVAPEQGSGKEGDSDRRRYGRPELQSAVVAVVLRMSCVIDGHPVTVEEVGDCEDPHNWRTDGQRAKDAFSDAYKRCAMRLGVALHLWVKDPTNNFYIAQKLAKADDEAGAPEAVVPDTEPIDPAVLPQLPDPPPPAAPEADVSAPSEPSAPEGDPEVPPTDWKARVRTLSLPESVGLAVAREVAVTFGVTKPVSLKLIEWHESTDIGNALAVALIKAAADDNPTREVAEA